MNGAAVAIVGGGVIGTSIAYHLARQGARDIVILERAPGPGLGSTGKATGGFRAQFATPINVRLSLMSRDALVSFAQDTGVDPGYAQVGYLWLASTEAQLASLRAALVVQKGEGLNEAMELAADDISPLNPIIDTQGLVGAAFCPTDGYIKPMEMLRGYIEAAESLGVSVRWNTSCVGMKVDSNGRITHVETTDDSIAVDAVVNAAGPWAAGLAAMCGATVPVTPLRRQAAITLPTDVVSPNMPMTIFMESGLHLRARYGRAMLCWPHPENAGEPAELRADDEWIASVTAMARERVPVLENVDIDRSLCYAGLYEMSPDHHAILGRSHECENLFLANGSSGHGVMHSPAIGEIVADIILGRSPRIDVTSLRPSRFDEGQPIQSSELL
jgi:sarcosine oxidase, subunit beta